MNLYIIRHGQTDMNVLHRMQGRTDTRLNEKGRQQAREAAKFLKKEKIVPDRVIVSPLDRARETAEIVSGRPRDLQEPDDRIIEMCFGEAEGKPNEELAQGFYESFFRTVVDYEPPDGAESYEDLFDRIADFVEDLRDQYVLCANRGAVVSDCEEPVQEDAGECHIRKDRRCQDRKTGPTIFVVSHGAALHALLAYVGHVERKDFWKIDVNNCAVFQVFLSDQKREPDGRPGSDYQDHFIRLYEGFGHGHYLNMTAQIDRK